MSRKLRLAVMCGGKSAEHEISLISGMNIARAVDRTKHDLLIIGVDKDGSWYVQDEDQFLAMEPDPSTITLPRKEDKLAVVPGDGSLKFIDTATGTEIRTPDVMFSILHGPLGEDGSMQGLFRILDIPFVGPGVLGSAVCMDKDIAKRLLSQAGIANAAFRVFRRNDIDSVKPDDVGRELGWPVFVKPANMGSSVGVQKVKSSDGLIPAVKEALKYDRKVLVEEFLEGRELECAVIGNEKIRASRIGEIVPSHEFYSFDAKYVDEKGAGLHAPAPNLEVSVEQEMQKIAIRAFQVLACEGMARVDFFLNKSGKIYVNEVNTLPGFTKISMYPRLWQVEGLSYSKLIDELIQLSMERHKRDSPEFV